ncbi:MAG: hypothetical protein JOY95_12205 [Silvibacterium sp.]|nr:hypothetical protein [Silvibacterium sp.]
MQRKAWFELHDHRLYPGFLRDLVTDALQEIWNAKQIYSPIARRLRRAVAESGAKRVVDLCSGGGGPWLCFCCEFHGDGVTDPAVLLTDKYPSRGPIRTVESRTLSRLSFHPCPVDAIDIPSDLTGFRTMFSTFHHFGPSQARAILKSAFEQRQGIGIFEAAKCDSRTLAAVIAVPLLALRLAPRIRPFRWSRIFWTYCVPVIPLTLWLDGLLSCLRSYSLADLRELTSGLVSEAYRWDIGEEHGGPVAITYLVGYPCLPVRSEDAEIRAAEVEEIQTERPA